MYKVKSTNNLVLTVIGTKRHKSLYCFLFKNAAVISFGSKNKLF